MCVLASMDAVFVMFGMGAVLLVVALTLIFSAKHKKAVRENWHAFAHAHGMHFTGNTSHGMHGNFGNTSMRIYTRVEGSGKNATTYTDCITDILPPLPRGLAFHRETFGSRLGKAFGTQDIQVGDAALDQALIIQGQDVAGIVRFMTIPEVRTAILSTFARHNSLRLENRQLRVTRLGTVHKRPDLNAMAQALDYVAQTLTVAASQGSGIAERAQPTRRRPRAQTQTTRRSAPAIVAAPPVVMPAAPAAPAPQPVPKPAPKPAPVVAVQPEPTPQPAASAQQEFADFAAKLSARSLMSSQRESVLREHAVIRWPLEVRVESVSRTFGFSLPDELRDGRTVEGTCGEYNVHVRMPKERSDEVSSLRRGDTFQVEAKAAAWDDLFKRMTFDA
jgi:hypothetical protein